MNLTISSTGGRPGLVLFSPSESHRVVSIVRAWMEGELTMDAVRDFELLLPQRRSLGLVVNNECNLNCSHCYLQIPQLAGKRLYPEDWNRAIESAASNGIEQFLLVGKEPLFGNTGPAVLGMLGTMRARRSDVRIGLITNGVLLHKHLDLVERVDLNHMDISMEGDTEAHDAIRGAGAFAEVRPNVETAARLFGDRLFVTMTLQKRNVHRIDKAIVAFASMGVRSISIAPYTAMPYTDPSLSLSGSDYQDFFAGLKSLESLELPHEILLQVDACAACPDMLMHFIGSGWFDLDDMVTGGTGSLYLNRSLSNGLVISFRFQPWHLSFDHHVRIAADGSMICSADVYRPREYANSQLANVRDFDFDFASASNAASLNPRLAGLDSRYEMEMAPRIRSAYRGRPKSPFKIVTNKAFENSKAAEPHFI